MSRLANIRRGERVERDERLVYLSKYELSAVNSSSGVYIDSGCVCYKNNNYITCIPPYSLILRILQLPSP